MAGTVIYEMPDGTELELPAAMKPEQVRMAMAQWKQQQATKPPAPDVAPPKEHPVLSAYKSVSEPVTQAVTSGLSALGGAAQPTADPMVQKASRAGMEAVARNVIVPQSPSEALMMGATLASPLLRAVPGVKSLPGAAQRIGAAALGSEVGAEMTGETPGKGAIRGIAATAPMEGVNRALETIVRGLPGMKGRIARQDADRIGKALEDASPALKGIRTVEDLREMASGKGKDLLGAAKEAVVTDIEAQLQRGQNRLIVPSLGSTPLTLREANDELSKIGARAFSQNPLDRTILGVDQRRLYGNVTQEIQGSLGGINPDLATKWTGAQADYRKGIGLVRLFENPSVYRNLTDKVELHTPALQRNVAQPRTEASLVKKLGQQGYEDFAGAVTRGGPIGSADVLVPGTGSMLEAGKEILRGKGGATQIPALVPRTLLPNLGSSYTGNKPYQIPGPVKAGLDVMGQKATLSVVPDDAAEYLASLLNPLDYLK